MPADAIFRLYSMTRPITSLAALMLYEEGKLGLDDPVSRYLPKLANRRVFDDPDDPVMTRTHPATREMMVTDLIRFTSGLGGRNSRIYRDHDVRSREISIQQFIENVAGIPLFEEPRSRWRYGISTTVLGRIVEVVSGQPLDEFLEEQVFEPLGMRDADFWVPRDARSRLATVYRPSDEGGLRPVQLESVPFTERPALIEGGIGLLSSTVDFLRFSQMCLNGGELDGVRLVTPETIAPWPPIRCRMRYSRWALAARCSEPAGDSGSVS